MKCLKVLFYGFYGKKEIDYYSKEVIVKVLEVFFGILLSI
jgi:hypothetical protein